MVLCSSLSYPTALGLMTIFYKEDVVTPPESGAAYPVADIPKTPAGEALSRLFNVLGSHDLQQIEAFIRRQFDPSIQNSDPGLLSRWYYGLGLETGNLNLVIVEYSSELEIAGYAVSTLIREWYRVKLELSSETAQLVAGIILRPVQRPSLAGPHPTMDDSAIVKDLERTIQKLVNLDLFSGSILVAYNGQPFFRQAYGNASLAFKIPNQSDTKFNVGSLYKIFTAVAICQLVERGLMSFNDPIIKYLPDFPHEISSRVTIHHLLTHTAGLGNYWNEQFEAKRITLRKVQDFIPLFRNDTLLFEPGTRWQYSNNGFILLGAVIEAVTNQDYYDYVRENIFQSCGMINTDAYEMDFPHENLAIGYTSTDLNDQFHPGQRRNNLFIHVVKGGPAGGGFSTVDDLLKFDQALRAGVLLSPEYVNILTSGKVAMGNTEGRQYAYGMMVNVIDGKRIVGHSGSFPGIGARFDMYLDHGYTAILLSNYDPHITQALGNKLREWIAGY
jgi:CubicO group peptidase (beta-lactamase class C family)